MACHSRFHLPGNNELKHAVRSFFEDLLPPLSGKLIDSCDISYENGHVVLGTQEYPIARNLNSIISAKGILFCEVKLIE